MVVVGRQPESRKGRATYAALVEATRVVLHRSGVLSPEGVAAEADVSVATFYAYFASKDEALAAAFDQVLAEMNAATRTALDPARLLDRGLEAVLRDLAKQVVKRFAHDARVVRLAISRLSESEVMRQVYRERQDEVLETLAAFVRRAAAAGAVRSDDPDRLATALLISVQGYQNPLLLQPGTGDVQEELVGMLLALLEKRRSDSAAERPSAPAI